MAYFQYIFLAIALFLAVVLPLFAAWGMVRAATGIGTGLGVLLVLYVYEVLVIAAPPLRLGINVYPADLVFAALAVLVVGRLFTQARHVAGMLTVAWLLFGLLSMALFVVGVIRHGTTAGVEFRQIFYLWVAASYVLSFSVSATVVPDVMRSVLRAAFALVAIALMRWADQLIGVTGVPWGTLVGANPWRVLDSDGALFLLLAWLWLYWRWTRGELSLRGIAGMQVLLVMVLLLQHRTVWICGLAAVFFLVTVDRRARSATLGRGLLTLGVMLTGLALVAAFGKLDQPLDAFGSSVSEAMSGRGSTLSWRTQGWLELIGQWKAGGPVTWLVGKEYGVGYLRYVIDLHNMTNYSPHSFYVRTLLRGGIVGLSAVMLVYGGVLWRAYKARSAPGDWGVVAGYVAASMLAIAIYSAAYDPDYGAALVLGLGIVVAMQQRPASALRQAKPALLRKSQA
jgi:hypothetical protein